jgi:hypothetical protein
MMVALFTAVCFVGRFAIVILGLSTQLEPDGGVQRAAVLGEFSLGRDMQCRLPR